MTKHSIGMLWKMRKTIKLSDDKGEEKSIPSGTSYIAYDN